MTPTWSTLSGPIGATTTAAAIVVLVTSEVRRAKGAPRRRATDVASIGVGVIALVVACTRLLLG